MHGPQRMNPDEEKDLLIAKKIPTLALPASKQGFTITYSDKLDHC